MSAREKALEDEGAFGPPDPWDPLVRISHWLIAMAVIANGLLNKAGGTAHIWIGWGVLGLLAIRLVWGFFGSPEARFSSFPPNPRAAVSHVFELVHGRSREYPSHNPAGALMIYGLWACLVVVTATGIFMTGAKSPIMIAEEKAAVASGDWSVLAKASARDSEAGKMLRDTAEEIHEVTANLLLVLALIHVGGVAMESRVLKRNLIRPMLVERFRRR